MLLILGYLGNRQRQLFARLLRSANIGRLINVGGAHEEDYDHRRRRARPDPDRFPKVPSETGTELMNSGVFGLNEAYGTHDGEIPKKKKLARRILDRELAAEDYVHQKLNHRLMAQVKKPMSDA